MKPDLIDAMVDASYAILEAKVAAMIADLTERHFEAGGTQEALDAILAKEAPTPEWFAARKKDIRRIVLETNYGASIQ